MRSAVGGCVLKSENILDIDRGFTMNICAVAGLASSGTASDPASILADGEDGSTVAGALSALSERERRIVELRYGLDGSEPLTLDDVARELGVSRQRVRTVEARLLKQLASRPELQLLREAA